MDATTAAIPDVAVSGRRLLTDVERECWNRDGYLHVRNALDSEQVLRLLEHLKGLREEFESASGKEEYWRDVFDAGNDRDLSLNNALRWCPGIDGLIDHPRIFEKVLALMGPHIQCVGSEIYVRYRGEEPLFDFHTDLGPSLRTVSPVSEKVIQLKAQVFLSNVVEPDCGNFTVVPGSHLTGFPGKISYAHVENRVQVLAAAGDVVLFPLSLGHGVAPNRRGDTRYSVIMRYAQMFCRSVDYWTSPSDPIMERLSPRQRRLMGDLGGHNRPGDFYGMIPDQLELMYGDEWRASPEAQAEFGIFRQMMSATPYRHPGINPEGG